MVERSHLLNLRVSLEELAKLRAVADANDEPMAMTVRRWIKTFYAQAFPAEPVPRAAKTRAKR